MAKSIRSKCKRRNRAEFRNSIGKMVVEANRSTVQEKLQECINKGSMSCLDRLSNLLSAGSVGSHAKVTVEDDVATSASSAAPSPTVGEGKSKDKTPVKAMKKKKYSRIKSPWQKSSKRISSKAKKFRG